LAPFGFKKVSRKENIKEKKVGRKEKGKKMNFFPLTVQP